jgi:hypothetical protein
MYRQYGKKNSSFQSNRPYFMVTKCKPKLVNINSRKANKKIINLSGFIHNWFVTTLLVHYNNDRFLSIKGAKSMDRPLTVHSASIWGKSMSRSWVYSMFMITLDLDKENGSYLNSHQKGTRFLKNIEGWAWCLKPIILSTWEEEVGRITDWGQSGQKCSWHSISTWTWGCMPVFQVIQESTNRKIKVHISLGLRWEPISKITNIKRDHGVVPVVECLPSKHWV